jgi:DNA invertase Pin-like site-specific DNA recombinase
MLSSRTWGREGHGMEKVDKRVAIYGRVSTAGKSQDVDLQLRDLRTYTASRGWVVFKEYIDDGVSGRKDKRPALDSMMNDARKRRFDVVVVWRFDRFARSTRHLVNSLEEFKHLGIDFVSFMENIDTSSPMGKAMFTIASAFAELEADLVKERVVAGLANARAKGKTLGRPKVELDEHMVALLRQRGLPMRGIANELHVSLGLVHKTLRNMGSQPLEMPTSLFGEIPVQQSFVC